MDITGMTPDEQMTLLVEINGPITMLVALEQVFRDRAEAPALEESPRAAVQSMTPHLQRQTNEWIADQLTAILRQIPNKIAP